MSDQELQNLILSNLSAFGLKIDHLVESVAEVKTCLATLDLRVTKLEQKEPENAIKKRFLVSTTGQYVIIVIALGSLSVAILSLLK